jgi:hypothetical protein
MQSEGARFRETSSTLQQIMPVARNPVAVLVTGSGKLDRDHRSLGGRESSGATPMPLFRWPVSSGNNPATPAPRIRAHLEKGAALPKRRLG